MKYFEMKKRAFMSIVNAVKGFIRKVSGNPPITLPDCVDDDSLISYSLGLEDTRKNLCKNPIHVYSYDKDYMVYNKANTVTLTPGTYTISGSRLPTLQFWDVNTKKYMKVVDVVSSYDRNSYYTVWEGRALAQTSSAVTTATFTITTPCIVTLCIQVEEISDCQIERGETATSFEPYVEPEKVGDKTKNLYDHANSTWSTTMGAIKTKNGVNIPISPDAAGITWLSETVPYDKSYTLSYTSVNTYGGLASRAVIRFIDKDGNNVSSSHAAKVYNSSDKWGTYNQYYNGIYIDSNIERKDVIIKYSAGTNIASFRIAFVAVGTVGEYIDYSDIMLEEGTTSTEYEPYGYKIPIKMSGKNLFEVKTPDKTAQNAYDGYGNLDSYSQHENEYTINAYGAIGFSFNNLVVGDTYTVSCKFVTTATMASNAYFWIGQNHHRGAEGVKSAKATATLTVGKRFKLTFTADKTNLITFAFSKSIDVSSITITDIQLEEGNVLTDYEPYINPITTNIILDEPLIAGNILEYPKDNIPKLPTTKGTTIYSVETEVQPSNMSVEYYATRKGE